MSERLTWEQIQERYPDQWVGLTEVEYEPDNDATIKSAILYELQNMVIGDLIFPNTHIVTCRDLM